MLKILTLLILAIASSLTIAKSCSWDNPGTNPYTGSVANAIDSYIDIPLHIRAQLKEKISLNNFYNDVKITRDTISGGYKSKIKDMHFGKNSICSIVTRNKWSEFDSYHGRVFCVQEECILIPYICGNVSRITKKYQPVETFVINEILLPDTVFVGMPLKPEEVFNLVNATLIADIQFVRVSAVPEPSEWLMLIIGICLGLLHFKRKHK